VYKKLYEHDKFGLLSMYSMFDSIKRANDLNQYEFAQVIVSMVQSLDYVLILDVGCTSNAVQRNREIQAMIRSGILCDGHHTYGIKTPLRFASDLKGDCDTRTVLLYTLLENFNFDVAIINSEIYQHSMLGLHLPNQNGAFKLHDGKKYYFWETTSIGYKLGELPRSNGNLNFWNVVLN
jgi:hypothetical protein